MTYLIATLAVLALLSTAVIFGTDVLTATVMRPALAEIDDRALVEIVGRTHRYGGQRLSVPGIASVVAAALLIATAAVASEAGAAIAAAIGLLLLLGWLTLFNRMSLPINKAFIAAVDTDTTLHDARALQDRWESIINLRAALQGAALISFSVALALT
jgi:hypothetical protein